MMEKISALMKEAMKAKQKERVQALRYIKSLLLENKTAKKPIDENDVIIRHYKKLNDSLELFKSDATRSAAIKEELEVVKEFMPEQLEESEVEELINKIIANLDNPNMGAVMKELSGQIKGKFDGKRASELVRSALS